MKTWFHRNFKTIVITAFLIPIIIVAIVSISHVTGWYGVSNPLSWSMYLSVGIEIAALSSLAAISINMGKKVYLPFGVVTFIQFIGNIFFSYSYIDINSPTFKMWVELVSPLTELINTESTDLISHKRILSLLSGGLLPLISLSFLHMLVSFSENQQLEKENNEKDNIDKDEYNIQKLSEYLKSLQVEDKIIVSEPKVEETKEVIEEVIEEIKTPDIKEEIQVISDNKDLVIVDDLVNKVLNKKERKRKKNIKNKLSDIDSNDVIPSFSIVTPIIEEKEKTEEKEDSENKNESEIDIVDESWDVGVEPIEVEKKKRGRRKK